MAVEGPRRVQETNRCDDKSFSDTLSAVITIADFARGIYPEIVSQIWSQIRSQF
jgi:hypothetical protein